MRQKNLLIVGVDPGTTLGYAVLDMYGKLVLAGSSKLLDFNMLVSRMTSLGRIVMVGCDKSDAPEFVSRFAVKVGARLVSPGQDLLVADKRDMTRAFEYGDDHQRDALASALIAHCAIRRLLRKIEVFVAKEKKDPSIVPMLQELVLVKNISIRVACEMIERPEAKVTQLAKAVAEEKQPTKEQFFQMHDMLLLAKKDMRLLRSQKDRIEEELADAKRRVSQIERREKRPEEDVVIRDRTIMAQQRKYSSKENECRALRCATAKLRTMLSISNDHVILKKLDNLGSAELKAKNPVLDIREGDMLMVENPSEYSDGVLEFLGSKVRVVFCGKSPSRKLESDTGFLFITERPSVIEDGYFACAKREDIDRLVDKKQMLSKIVDEYRAKRSYSSCL